MDDQIIAVFCFCDDLLKAMRHQEDPQCHMGDAEVMTTALIAALEYGGNFEKARRALHVLHYIPRMLGASRFNRRLHRIKSVFLTLFHVLAEVWKDLNTDAIYSFDSFPIAVCDNIRIARAKIYHDNRYRGYIPSKRRYFYGVKVHLMVTATGRPVEFFLTPGSLSDVEALELFDFDLPPGSTLYADRAYNDYQTEDELLASAQLTLQPMRKKDSTRPFPPYIRYLQYHYRKRVETAGSLIERLLPKSIHAVTATGFELKVVLFVLASSINCL